MTEASMLCTPSASCTSRVEACRRILSRPTGGSSWRSERYAASEKGKREKAVQARKNIESRMTSAQIEQAQKLVREWKPGIQ